MTNQWQPVDFDPTQTPLSAVFPLSYMQKEIWSALAMGQGNATAFNESMVIKITGSVDLERLKEAVRNVTKNVEALRSVLSPDGLYVCVLENIDIPVETVSVSPGQDPLKEIEALADRPFHLSEGPLVRFSIIQHSPEEIFLLQTAHHIVCDGWSASRIVERIFEFYSEGSLHPIASGVEQFNQHWQTSDPESIKYWQDLLAKKTRSIPFKRIRKDAERAFQASRIDYRIGSDEAELIKIASRKTKVSLHSFMLTSFQISCYLATKQANINVGVPFAQQIIQNEFDLIGHCTSMLPITSTIGMSSRFQDLAVETYQKMLKARQYGQTTLSDIVRSIPSSRSVYEMPIANAVFNLDPRPEIEVNSCRVEVSSVVKRQEAFEVFINARVTNDGFTFETSFDASLYQPEVIYGVLKKLHECLMQAARSLEFEVQELAEYPNEFLGGHDHQSPSAPAIHDRKVIDPANDAEKVIIELWKEFLGVPELYEDDDFFLLGGHSLLAAQIITRINQELAVDFRVNDILRHSAIKVFLESCSLDSTEKEEPSRNIDAHLPSLVQEQMWMSEKIFKNSNVLHYLPSAWTIAGPLHIQRFEEAFRSFCQSQLLMKASFQEVGGLPRLVYNQESPSLEVIDLRHQSDGHQLALRDIEAQGKIPFDLVKGPLFKARMYRTGPQQQILFIGVHHLIWDGWSFDIFLDQIIELYGETNHVSSFDYRKFVSWERNLDASEDLSYWENRFKNPPHLLEIPTDKARPAEFTFAGDHELFTIDRNMSLKIDHYCRAHRTTPFMLFMSIYSILLANYSDQDDLVIGIPTRRRTKADFESIVGPFINNLPIRIAIDHRQSFANFLQQTHQQCIEDLRYENLYLDQLMSSMKLPRDESRHQLIGAMFSFQETSERPNQIGDCSLEQIFIPNNTIQTDLMLWVKRHQDGYSCGLDYYKDIFKASTIKQFNQAYLCLLNQVVEGIDQPIKNFRLNQEVPKVGFHDEFSLFSDQFANQVRRGPNQTSLILSGDTTTYQELYEKVQGKLWQLNEIGIREGLSVGVMMNRGEELIVTLLALLRMGATYIPLDPQYPEDRLHYMIVQSGMNFILADQEFTVKSSGVKVHHLPPAQPTTRNWQGMSPQPDTPAYVIYTSGSTGKPKGVMISHRALGNFLSSMGKSIPFGPKDRVLALTTISFDISILEMFLTLANGASLAIASIDQTSDGKALASYLEKTQITIMQATPATWNMLVNSEWPGRPSLTAICGGEALTSELAKGLLDRVDVLWNAYGPTEATVWSTLSRIESSDEITIGSAMDNYYVDVLDENLSPVPQGMRGTIFIGGPSLASGYLGREDLTRERFLQHPNYDFPLYDTGDVGRISDTGDIIYLGRKDSQVKVRGFRIELGEIESNLLRHSAIDQAVVIIREDRPGDQRIVAYIKTTNQDLSIGKINQFLGETLPRYMLPNHLVLLTEFPLTGSGKIDRKNLPAPASPRKTPENQEFSPSELAIAEMWQELIGASEILPNDNFFALGGHSLAGLRFIAILKDHTGAEVKIRDLMTGTLRSIAAGIDGQVRNSQLHRTKVKPGLLKRIFGR